MPQTHSIRPENSKKVRTGPLIGERLHARVQRPQDVAQDVARALAEATVIAHSVGGSMLLQQRSAVASVRGFRMPISAFRSRRASSCSSQSLRVDSGGQVDRGRNSTCVSLVNRRLLRVPSFAERARPKISKTLGRGSVGSAVVRVERSCLAGLTSPQRRELDSDCGTPPASALCRQKHIVPV
jgi:hypothetical protein